MPTRLGKIAATIKKEATREIVEEAAAQFVTLAKASASRVVGGGPTMNMHTRRGRKPVRLNATAKVSGGGSKSTAEITASPQAQWRWIEDGTKPHRIGWRGGFLSAPRYDHPVRGPVSHPGSKGQRAWTRAVGEFEGEYPDIGLDVLQRMI